MGNIYPDPTKTEYLLNFKSDDAYNDNPLLRRRRMPTFVHFLELVQTRGGVPQMTGGCARGVLRLWDLRSERVLSVEEIQKTPVTAMAAHPRVPVLASGSHNQYVNVSRVYL